MHWSRAYLKSAFTTNCILLAFSTTTFSAANTGGNIYTRIFLHHDYTSILIMYKVHRAFSLSAADRPIVYFYECESSFPVLWAISQLSCNMSVNVHDLYRSIDRTVIGGDRLTLSAGYSKIGSAKYKHTRWCIYMDQFVSTLVGKFAITFASLSSRDLFRKAILNNLIEKALNYLTGSTQR